MMSNPAVARFAAAPDDGDALAVRPTPSTSMDLEHVNHFEREGVLPIAFCLFHITNMMDASFMLMTGTPPDLERRVAGAGAG